MTKREWFRLIGVILVLLVCVAAVTLNQGGDQRVKTVTITLSSDEDGSDTETLTASMAATNYGHTYVSGFAHRIVTNPGDGSSSPTDDWDVTVLDSLGIDILNSQGLNRDQTNTENVNLTVHTAFVGPLSVVGAAMGSTHTATVTFIFGDAP